MGVVGAGDALVTLAVVVGTYIKDGMILAVVPADKLLVTLSKREEVVATAFVLFAFLNLCQQPRTRDNGVGLEELNTRGAAHFT